MSNPFKIGAVPYLNALPLIEGLPENPAVQLRFAPPAQLESELDAGTLDAALLPVASLFDRPRIAMFSFAGIASENAAGSVLFFSQGSKVRKVAYDEGSRTSVMLLKLLLKEKGHSPEWIPMPSDLGQMLNQADGALLIGDNALISRRDHRLEFDLVERWRGWTDLPFVFAVWAARADHPRRSEMSKLFTDASVQGLSRLDAIAHRKSGHMGLSSWEILTYFKNNMSYRLGKPHLDAIELFRAKCAQMTQMTTAADRDKDKAPVL